MTNQNVVLSDARSGIDVRITVSLSNSSLFSAPVPQPLREPDGFLGIPRKKILKTLDSDKGGQKINSWVDSMRASSPSREKTTTSLVENEEQSSWIVSLISL